MDIEELSARAEITDALSRYARGIDSKDWALWRSVFTEDATLDYSSANGPVGDREAIGAWLEASFAHIEGAHHYLSNIEITLNGDEAEVLVLFYNPFRAVWTETFSAAGGYYRHTFVRTADGWKSKALYEDNRWIQDAPGLPPGM